MLERVHLVPQSIRFWCPLVAAVSLGTASVLAAATDSGDADDFVIVRTGGELYRNHCAICLGPDAAGDGPFSKLSRTPPADLTQLAARTSGSSRLAGVRKDQRA
jgi:mono/diheme cytochrome c family protein